MAILKEFGYRESGNYASLNFVKYLEPEYYKLEIIYNSITFGETNLGTTALYGYDAPLLIDYISELLSGDKSEFSWYSFESTLIIEMEKIEYKNYGNTDSITDPRRRENVEAARRYWVDKYWVNIWRDLVEYGKGHYNFGHNYLGFKLFTNMEYLKSFNDALNKEYQGQKQK